MALEVDTQADRTDYADSAGGSLKRMPARPAFPRTLFQPLFGWLTGCLIGACSVAAASEMIGPLPPRAMPAPASRPPLAPVTGEHARPTACNTCRGECHGGPCRGHCPVRPDEFGFYSTQWRTWPAAATQQPPTPETLTPVSPPRSEVPGVDQESLPLPSAEGDASEPEAAPLPAPGIPVPDRRDRQKPEEDAAPPAETEESNSPLTEPQPPAAKPATAPAEEDNLFDEARRPLSRAAVLALANQKAIRHQGKVADAASVGERPTAVVRVVHEEPLAGPSTRMANPLRASSGAPSNPLRGKAARTD